MDVAQVSQLADVALVNEDGAKLRVPNLLLSALSPVFHGLCALHRS